MKKKTELKRFIIRKYIVAASAQEAIRKDKTLPVDDVWIDQNWINDNRNFGFAVKK
jgi:hypothetical protein